MVVIRRAARTDGHAHRRLQRPRGRRKRVAAALAEGEDSVLLPHDATASRSILGQAVTVTTV